MAIHFKPEVRLEGVQREIFVAIGYVFGLLTSAGYDTVITSANDGVHNNGSLHPKGLAVDIRSRHIPDGDRARLFNEMRSTLKPCGYDVIEEGSRATAATTAAHWHLEYQPHSAQQSVFEAGA
jgi:hypothetical protein